jgi:hypothetical protein
MVSNQRHCHSSRLSLIGLPQCVENDVSRIFFDRCYYRLEELLQRNRLGSKGQQPQKEIPDAGAAAWMDESLTGALVSVWKRGSMDQGKKQLGGEEKEDGCGEVLS